MEVVSAWDKKQNFRLLKACLMKFWIKAIYGNYGKRPKSKREVVDGGWYETNEITHAEKGRGLGTLIAYMSVHGRGRSRNLS